MNNVRFIYTLSCPKTKEIRYVGQTNNLNARFRKHIHTSAKNPTIHSQCWINGLLKKGLKPVMEVVADCTIEDVDNEETFYISMFRFWGFNLTNLDSGGTVEKVRSKETIEKVSRSLTGKKHSIETKLKRSVSVRQAWKDEKLKKAQRCHYEKMVALGKMAVKGLPSKKKGIALTDEVKQKTANGLKKYYSKHHSAKKIVFNNLSELIGDYKNLSMPLAHLSKKYNVNRTLITKTMKDNNVPFRNGAKYIEKEVLEDILINKKIKMKEAATYLNCSEGNIDKFKKIYGIYINKKKNDINRQECENHL